MRTCLFAPDVLTVIVLTIAVPVGSWAEEPSASAASTNQPRDTHTTAPDKFWDAAVVPIDHRLAFHTNRFTVWFVGIPAESGAKDRRVQISGEPEPTAFAVDGGYRELALPRYSLFHYYKAKDRLVITARGAQQEHRLSVEKQGTFLRVNRKYTFPLAEGPALILVNSRRVATQVDWNQHANAQEVRAKWKQYLDGGPVLELTRCCDGMIGRGLSREDFLERCRESKKIRRTFVK